MFSEISPKDWVFVIVMIDDCHMDKWIQWRWGISFCGVGHERKPHCARRSRNNHLWSWKTVWYGTYKLLSQFFFSFHRGEQKGSHLIYRNLHLIFHGILHTKSRASKKLSVRQHVQSFFVSLKS
jgi:hypothetical protein